MQPTYFYIIITITIFYFCYRIMFLTFVRAIHKSNTNWSSTKTQLLKLRKKTGYPFESCKKALQLNDNNLEKVNV